MHWLISDIDPRVTSLPEGAAQGTTPARMNQLKPYAGPFPPSGTHAYEFTLYALNTDTLGLREKATLETFTQVAKQNCLASATLVGTFTKTKNA